MQGRLVPPEGDSIQQFPRERWRDEFALAADAGLDGIEWIYDVHGADVNPLATDDGIAELKSLALRHGITVASVCADFFIDCPLLRVTPELLAQRVGRLTWLIGRCHLAGVERVVLPFVDAARIETDDERATVVDVVGLVTPACMASGIELHLETSLDPTAFSTVLAELPDHVVRVTYDSGNSAALGYDVADELAAYGPRIGSVHVKDRLAGGGTVPLGQGHADLNALCLGLQRLGYRGDYVLQVARGVSGQELEWTRANRSLLVNLLSDAAASLGT